MSMVVAFDTLKYANELKNSGMNVEQAEAQTSALASVMNELVQGALATKQDIAATKQDIAEVRQELKHDISEVRQELKHDIAEVNQELKQMEWKLTVRLGGIVSIGVTVLAALMVILRLT